MQPSDCEIGFARKINYLTRFSAKLLNGDNLTASTCFGRYPLGYFGWIRDGVGWYKCQSVIVQSSSERTFNWINPGNRESVAWCWLVTLPWGASWVRRPSRAPGTQGLQFALQFALPVAGPGDWLLRLGEDHRCYRTFCFWGFALVGKGRKVNKATLWFSRRCQATYI